MKVYVGLLMLACTVIFMSTSPMYAQVTVKTALRYNSFRDNLSPKTEGDEFTIPLSIAYQSKSLSLNVKTAYSSANVAAENFDEATLSSVTDTFITAAYVHTFKEHGISLLGGLNVNLPTGKESLSAAEKMTEFGQGRDLFDVDNFGDGLNVGLSLGGMKEFGTLSLSLLGSYVVTGEYDPTTDQEDDSMNPGNQTMVAGMAVWQPNAGVNVSTFTTYSQFGADEVEGEKNLQTGSQFGIGGSVRLGRETFAVFANVFQLFQGKSDVLLNGSLEKEPENSNRPLFFGTVGVNYPFSDTLTLEVQGDIRHYTESDLTDASTELPYASKRVRYALTPSVAYQINERLSLNGGATYFTMDKKQDMYMDEAVKYQGFVVEFGVAYAL